MQSPTKIPELAEVRTVGLQLCTKLRELGSRVASLQADATKLADTVQCHWRVIDSLAQRLRSSEAVHNPRAIVLVQAIIKSTLEIFHLIGNVMPNKNPDSFAYTLLVKQKIKSLYKKTPVENLVPRIEFLRCAAQLLVTTLTIGEKVKWIRLFGRGNPSDRVEFETTRIEDRPAKFCLSEAVLATITTFHKDCDDVWALLPSAPYQSTTNPTLEEDASRQEEFVSNNIEFWWKSLLTEWTTIEDRKIDRAKDDKKPKAKKPRVNVIAIIEEDVVQESHPLERSPVSELSVH